jgi:hypothetical protein
MWSFSVCLLSEVLGIVSVVASGDRATAGAFCQNRDGRGEDDRVTDAREQ